MEAFLLYLKGFHTIRKYMIMIRILNTTFITFLRKIM